MPSKQVTFQGILTWDEGAQPPVGQPEHPIYLPPQISGGPGSLPPFPSPPIYYPPQGGGRPEHPIYYPPQISGGPGSLPPYPSPPIYNPPGIWGPPQMPPGFWGGGMGPGVRPPSSGGTPEHPIYLPPVPPGGFPVLPELPTKPEWGDMYVLVWNPKYGWIVVPVDEEGKPIGPGAGVKPEHPIVVPPEEGSEEGRRRG